MINRNELIAALKESEGVRFKAYRDTVGKLTIGIGRNLDDVGLTADEVDFLFKTDIETAFAEARRFPFFEQLTHPRQAAIVDMLFQLGMTRFKGFRKMIKAIDRGDYQQAAVECLDSRYARQTPTRARRIAAIIELGVLSK